MTSSTFQTSPINLPFKSEQDYDRALARVYELLQVEELAPDTPEGAELQLLTILVEDYEKKHHPVPPPHPLEAIRFMMEQKGISEAEIAKVLGGRSRKSEIFSGKRKLSLEMIRRLSAYLQIPADVLVQPY